MKHGFTKNKKQRYFCHDCQRSSREDPQPNGYTQEQREEILRAYEERSSLRGLTRTFGVARNSVTQWLREKKDAPRVSHNLGCPSGKAALRIG